MKQISYDIGLILTIVISLAHFISLIDLELFAKYLGLSDMLIKFRLKNKMLPYIATAIVACAFAFIALCLWFIETEKISLFIYFLWFYSCVSLLRGIWGIYNALRGVNVLKEFLVSIVSIIIGASCALYLSL